MLHYSCCAWSQAAIRERAMPPKVKFQKNDIVQTAFEIVRKRGFKELSARAVAQQLHCSTRPIYSYFNSMEELDVVILKKAAQLLVEYQTTERTGNVFLDIGIGYVLFALNEKHLFALMFNESVTFKRHRENIKILGIDASLIEAMKTDPGLEGMSEEQLRTILTKMWIFTHGLASLISVKDAKSGSEQDVIKILMEVGRAVIADAKNMSTGQECAAEMKENEPLLGWLLDR
jgi:AcrR family transcriptional regulator